MKTPISKEMQKQLLCKIRNVDFSSNKGTLKALQKRRLLDDDGELTPMGWAVTMEKLPLAEQCKHLGIEHIKHCSWYEGRPETFVLDQYFAKGFRGGFSEGGAILLLIRAAALECFVELDSNHYRRGAAEAFTEGHLSIYKDQSDKVISAIRAATEHEIIERFSEIYSYESTRDWFPNVTPEFIRDLFLSLGTEHLANITSAIIEDPYKYRAGWPDLTLFNGKELLWLEVKTTDKLHLNQINTIRRMKSVLPGTIRVFQLIKEKI